ncbi:hypothetical protein AKJ12_10270 [Xanthomonas arboricola pv. juglandis]|nr:hypothetical protein AKJ12_10270 [Xanthomonas arboricola pv. juglandis]
MTRAGSAACSGSALALSAATASGAWGDELIDRCPALVSLDPAVRDALPGLAPHAGRAAAT